MPKPDQGDVFLDFEGHPFWRADTGLFFLFGLVAQDAPGAWSFKAFWAHDPSEEAAATEELIAYLADRRETYPDMHVYHYNHTERSSLERLAQEHGVGETTLARMVETGLFIDLLVVAQNALQVGTESYGLKYLERLAAYERGHEIDKGAGAVIQYEEFMKTGLATLLDQIAAYNEDDVCATRALRDWLIEQRPEGTEWRASHLDPADAIPELDENIAALHAFGLDTPEYLLGDLLGYWRREWRAYVAPKIIRVQDDTLRLLDDPEVIAGMSPVGPAPRFGAKGKELEPGMRFRFPPQECASLEINDDVLYATPLGPIGFTKIERLDPGKGEVDISWGGRPRELGIHPNAVILHDWVPVKPKPEALGDLATRLLDRANGEPNPVSLALLRRDLPRLTNAPSGTLFNNDLEEMKTWSQNLDRSYVAVQGPPGTGKTYRGSHISRARRTRLEQLRRSGREVEMLVASGKKFRGR